MSEFKECPSFEQFRDLCINYGMAMTELSHLKALKETHETLPSVVIEHAEQRRRNAFDKMETAFVQLTDFFDPLKR